MATLKVTTRFSTLTSPCPAQNPQRRDKWLPPACTLRSMPTPTQAEPTQAHSSCHSLCFTVPHHRPLQVTCILFPVSTAHLFFFLIVKNTLFTYGCFVCVCRYLMCAEVRRGAGFLGTVTNDGALRVRCWELTPRPSKRAASALNPELSLQPPNCLCWNQWPREKVSMASIPSAPNIQQCRQQQMPHKFLGDHLIPDILGELYLG